MIEIKRTNEHGHPIAAVDITVDQLEYIWHSLRSVDDDFRAPVIEEKIGWILNANTTS